MEVLRWRTHLNPVLAAALILILAVWLIILFQRQRTSRSLRQTILLLLPKVLIVLLVILAYFDPVRSVIQRPGKDKKIMVLLDTSSSMDCKDELGISRAERAGQMSEKLAEKLGPLTNVEVLHFDMDVHDGKETGPGAGQIRGTDLGKSLVSISDKADKSDYISAILLSDGGDEVIQSPRLPEVPLYITGVGSDPDSWNDLAVTDVRSPALVAESSNFEVTAEVAGRFASRDFASKVPVVQVCLEERQQDQWQVLGSEYVRLDGSKARAKFSRQAPSEPGLKEYRIRVKDIPGELSDLNNIRNFSLEVRKEILHVLFFAQELGWDFSMIRKELARDESVELTALFRISEQRFIVQGTRRQGDEKIEAGFPASKKVLDLYKCIIIGSFGSSQWQQDQLEALLEYVRDGGAVVFLGGESSYGRGGYGGTSIEPLFPWRISNTQSAFQIGRFAVSAPAAALNNETIAQTAKIISQLSSVTVESVNVEGPLKSGATTLLEASVGGRSVPLVSVQRYGQGQTMAVATNTLWKWCRDSDSLKDAYGYFWRQAVKNMMGWEEGQRFLAVKWDQEQYSPGETALATIRVAGRHDADQLRLEAKVKVGESSTPVSVEPMAGQENTFAAEMNFSKSAQYVFELNAFVESQVLESYEKKIVVGTRLNEGANLQVDHAFLDNLATQTGGRYFPETEFENLIGTIRSRILSQAVSMEIPLVEDSFVYILIFVVILVAEWIIRRRMNLL
jgi:uncharacterized membrane protein